MSRKSYCKRGHPLSGDNLYEYDNGQKVFRLCRTCRRTHNRRAARKRARETRNRCDGCGRFRTKNAKTCSACRDPKPRDQYVILKADREYILARDGHCLKCGSTDDLTIDHVLPRALGGGDNRENLQALCFACNLEKRDTYADYRPDSDGQLALALSPPKQASTFEERIAEKTTSRGNCLIWTGAKLSSGVPAMKVDGVNTTVKRAIYEHHDGPVPDGLCLYSTCGNTACVATEHLLAAPPGRQTDGTPTTISNEPSFTCGHPRHPSNFRRDGERLRCRTCRNASARRYTQRQARDHQAA